MIIKYEFSKCNTRRKFVNLMSFGIEENYNESVGIFGLVSNFNKTNWELEGSSKNSNVNIKCSDLRKKGYVVVLICITT